MRHEQYLQHKDFFREDGWDYDSNWIKEIRKNNFFLIIRVNKRILDDRFAVSFHFFSENPNPKPNNFIHAIDLHSVDADFVSCLNKIKRDLISTGILSDECKKLTSAEIDKTIDFYTLFKIHEA